MGAALRMSLLMSIALAVDPEPARTAEREAARLAEAAIELCGRADWQASDARSAMLRRGLALADRALARDESVARAHFAVFCTLGKLVEDDGLGWRTLGSARRVRDAVDRAVLLAPDDVDALVGKGVLLLRLPRLLGGDEREAAACLRRALDLEPWHATARQYWARLHPGDPPPPALSAALAAE